MKIGDLVIYRWPSYLGNPSKDCFELGRTGVILMVENWIDQGAPDRNFGTKVSVMWDDQSISDYDPDELDIIYSD